MLALNSTSTTQRISLLLILFLAVAVRLPWLTDEIQGPYLFREGHVASQIDSLAENGLSVTPPIHTLNNPRLLFDLPVYQWLVTAATAVTGGDPVHTGRVLSLLLALAALVMIWRLAMSVTGFMIAAVLFALSPLFITGSTALLPDVLAMLLALAWFERDSHGSHRHLPWAVLSAAVKPTILFGLWCARLYDNRKMPDPKARGLGYRRLFCHLGVFMATALAVRFYSISLLPPGGDAGLDWAWFFGALADRFSLEHYTSVAVTILTRYAAPGIALLILAELLIRRTAEKPKPAKFSLRGLVYGQLVLFFVFLPLYGYHEYYHLSALAALLVLVARIDWHLDGIWLHTALALWIVSWLFVRAEPMPHTVWQAAGKSIAAHTAETDLIIYTGVANWHPAPLYFAGRDGYNIGRRSFNKANLAVFKKKHPKRRIYIYLPAKLADKLGYHVKGLQVKDIPGGRLVLFQ